MRVRFGINFMPTAPAARGGRLGDGGRGLRLRAPRHLGLAVDLPRRLHDARPLCAANTERIRFGPRVITPVTRHPAVAASAAATLEELAPGRTMVGIGSGDSAAYNIGLRPASLAELREYAQTIRGLLTTGGAMYHGNRATLTWSRARVPHLPRRVGPEDAAAGRPDRRRGGDPHRDHAGDRARLDRPGTGGSARRPGAIPRRSTCGGGPTSTWRRATVRRSRRSRCRWPRRATTSALHDRGQAHPARPPGEDEDPGRALRVRRARAAGQRQLPPHRGAGAGRLPRRPLRHRGHAGRVHQEAGARGRGGSAAVLDEHPLRRQVPAPPGLGRARSCPRSADHRRGGRRHGRDRGSAVRRARRQGGQRPRPPIRMVRAGGRAGRADRLSARAVQHDVLLRRDDGASTSTGRSRSPARRSSAWARWRGSWASS